MSKICIGINPDNQRIYLTLNIEEHKGDSHTTIHRTQITEYKKLSICGSYAGGGGQINRTIRKELDNYKKLFLPKDKILRILDIWDNYHLNDMRPGCVHQTGDKWDRNKQIEFVSLSVAYVVYGAIERQYNKDTAIDKSITLSRASRFSSAGDLLFRLQDANIRAYGWTPISTIPPAKLERLRDAFQFIPEHELKSYLESRRIAEAEGSFLLPRKKFPLLTRTEVKFASWVKQFEHPEGFLCKPCEVCGYQYGSAWLVNPLPPEIETEIRQLFAPADSPDSTKITNIYDEIRELLKSWGVNFRSVHYGDRCPGWCDPKEHIHGDRHVITMWRKRDGRKRIAFDFWNSLKDKEAGNAEVDPYSVIATLQFYDPGTFEDFCSEYGYDQDSRAAEKTYIAVKTQYSKLKKFFSEEEREQLARFK